MSARFVLPEAAGPTASGGAMWGPPTDSVPPQFRDLPFYRDFSKSSALRRAADWTAAGAEQMEYRQNARAARQEAEALRLGNAVLPGDEQPGAGDASSGRGGRGGAAGGRGGGVAGSTGGRGGGAAGGAGDGGIFGYTEGDDAGFQLVDLTSHASQRIKIDTPGARGGGRGRGRGGARGGRGRGGRAGGWGSASAAKEGAFTRGKATGRNDGQSRYGRRWQRRWTGQRPGGNLSGWGRQEDEQGIKRPWAIDPQAEWEHLYSADLEQIAALVANEGPGSGKDLKGFGTLLPYTPSFDRASVRHPVAITADEYAYPNLTASEDPILREFAASPPEVESSAAAGDDDAADAEAEAEEPLLVFATDAVLAHLMASTRSAASWDVVVRREGKKIWLDKRDNSEELNLLSVNENGVDPPMGSDATELNIEATFVGQAFAQQVLDKSSLANDQKKEEEGGESAEEAAGAAAGGAKPKPNAKKPNNAWGGGGRGPLLGGAAGIGGVSAGSPGAAGPRAAPLKLGEADAPLAQDGDDRKAAALGHKYRAWDVSLFAKQEAKASAAFTATGARQRAQKTPLGTPFKLFARCEYTACATRDGKTVPITVKALNESYWEGNVTEGEPRWRRQRDSRIDFRQNVDARSTAVLAHELKLNANKVAKWMAEIVLGDSQLLKLGYVSRRAPKDDNHHVLLGTAELQPKEFAMQIQFSQEQAWATLAEYVRIIRTQAPKDGVYLFMRDPEENKVHFYSVPSVESLEVDADDDDEGEEWW